MKKENFVDGGTVDPNWLTELMNKVSNVEERILNEETYSTGIAGALQGHMKDTTVHVSAKERKAWNDAADKVGKLNFEGALATVEAAKEAAVSSESAAVSAKNYAEAAAGIAGTSADEAKGCKSAAAEYADSARSEKEVAKGYAGDASGFADSARTYMYRASECAGNASNHAKRAEEAAKNAERFSGGVRAGVVVDRVEDLPEGASVGCVCYVRTATNAVLVTGKFSEFFVSEGWPSNVYSLSEDLYSYMDYELDYTENGVVHFGAYVLNVDGTTVGGGGIFGCGIAVWNTTENLYGYDSGNPNAEVSFYLSNSNEVIYGAPFKGYSWNGSAWVELAMAENVGKIDEALDAILKMDADIFGGDA